MKKRIIALILCLLMLCLAGCKGSEPEVSNEPVSETSKETTLDDILGAPINYKGAEFVVLQRPTHQYEFASDDTVSKMINDEIANRNALVEQRYNIKIKTIEVEGDWTTWESFKKYIVDTVQSGNTDYDLISGYAVAMANTVSNKVFIDWRELDEYMNLDKEWWYQDFIDQMTINGKTFMIAGDINLTIWESMYGMFFNKQIVESNPDIGNLYQMVRDKEWTYDNFTKVLKAAYVESDSDENKVYAYGTFTTTQIDCWQDAFNIPVTEKDENGRPEITLGTNSKISKVLENIYELANNPYTYKATGTNDTLEHFGKGKSVFTIQSVGEGTTLKNYNIEYGILPLPKYDEQQENYHSTCQDYYSVLAIPNTEKSKANLEFIGRITEALCYYSRQNVVPKYYEEVLQLRNTFDADTAEMIDTIRDGLLCNFGYIYSMALNWPAHQLNVLINADKNVWGSNWEEKEDQFIANLDSILEIYED